MWVFSKLSRRIALILKVGLRVPIPIEHSYLFDGEDSFIGKALHFVDVRVGAVIDLVYHEVLDTIV